MSIISEFFKPAPHKPFIPEEKQDAEYKKMRLKVFAGAFLGYSGYYLVRSNMNLAKPFLLDAGFTPSQIGFAATGITIAYGFSKFIMGNMSDRSDARKFLTTGLVLSAILMCCAGLLTMSPWFNEAPTIGNMWPILVLFSILLMNGWVQGMGWPPCGRVMSHWFSAKERGTKMALWNVSHNTGQVIMSLLAGLSVMVIAYLPTMCGYNFQLGLQFLIPASGAFLIAIIIWQLVRDTPQSCGLPPIEIHSKDKVANYSASHEKELSAREIFVDYVLKNKLLWFIAFANGFVYLIRYGMGGWLLTYLKKTIGPDGAGLVEQSVIQFAYGGFEASAIIGTLLCGYLSDTLFKGRRSTTLLFYMVATFVAILCAYAVFISETTHVWMYFASTMFIGFLIYGPVMLIGVYAIDLVPKKAAGTAAGFTGVFGYLIGAVFADLGMGMVIQNFGYGMYFYVLMGSALMAITLTAITMILESRKRKLA